MFQIDGKSHAGEEIDGNEMHGGFPCMIIVLVYLIAAVDPTNEDPIPGSRFPAQIASILSGPRWLEM